MPRLAPMARQELRALPAQLALARMLELPTLALSAAIREELDANPALEELEGAARPVSTAVDHEARLMRVAAPASLADALLADLRASLPAASHPLAELIVGSLDEHGFLSESPAGLARAASATRGDVAAVLGVLRELGPPGIGAAGPRECLLAQLDALAAAGEAQPLARTLVGGHLEALGAGRYRSLARSLGVEADQVAAAHAFIRQRLWPYPLQAISTAAAPDQRRYRVPDLLFRAAESGYAVELATAPGRLLQLSPAYLALLEAQSELSSVEQEHVRAYIERARLFLGGLRRRAETLLKVGEAIASRQAAFLERGPRSLVPLTRLQVAADLHMHESTVARAVTDKTARLPDGALWPLEDCFVAARPAQEELRELVAAESRPLSDQELAQLLAERGHPIARRTVAKYREQLGIPAQHLRGRRG